MPRRFKVDGYELHEHIEDFVKMTKRDDVAPTRVLWDSMHEKYGITSRQVRSRFRDMPWDDIMELVGAKSRKRSIEVTAANISRFCDYYGRPPTRREYDDLRDGVSNVKSSWWLRNRYGSWDNAMKEMIAWYD